MSGSLFQVSITTAPSLGICRLRAPSSTTSPLEALMNIAPGCILLKKLSFAIARVVSSRGVCIVTIWQLSSSSSREQKPSGPSAAARGGSHKKSLNPSLRAISATSDPTCPTPIIPIALPLSNIALRAATPNKAENTYCATPPALQPWAL